MFGSFPLPLTRAEAKLRRDLSPLGRGKSSAT
jgi:hypothetical protein